MSDLAFPPALPEATVPAPLRANARRHLIAAALSAVVPGAGQLFLGRRKAAILLFIGLAGIISGFWPLRLARSYHGLLFLLWMCLLSTLYAIYDALLGRHVNSGKRMSRWWIPVAIPLHYVSVNLIFTSLLIGSGFRALRFASDAMEPTIAIGDKFVFDKQYYWHHVEDRGVLAVIQRPDGITVKRIIAVGGDTIEGKNRAIFLNGQLQDEPFIQHKLRAGTDPELDTFGPVQVPPGKYFVMGDNRDVSLDSRVNEFGLVDMRSIKGKPLYGYHIINKPLWWEIN